VFIGSPVRFYGNRGMPKSRAPPHEAEATTSSGIHVVEHLSGPADSTLGAAPSRPYSEVGTTNLEKPDSGQVVVLRFAARPRVANF
jgi:hypothetical protein